MNERLYACLHECCPRCGAKVFRVILTDMVPDDGGDSFFATKIRDRCEDHEHVIRESSVVSWPCARLDEIFDRWSRQQITREEFDALVIGEITRLGGSWSAKVS